MACTIDESALPILTGCPGPNELIVVGNAVGGLDANGGYTVGYGRRYWSAIAACSVAAIKFFFNQFIVGQGGSPISPGGSVITLNFSSLGISSILQDSVFITASGPELPRNDNTQVSYTVAYNPTNVVITLNEAVSDGDQFILHYAYTS
jgi:hypothetical protein